MAGDLVAVDALGPGGRYRTHSRAIIADTRGEALLDMSVVPRLYATRTIAAQRKAAPLPIAERATTLGRAAEIFASATIAGLSFDDYVELTCRISGLPLTVARAGADVVAGSLSTALASVRAALPAGATMDWRDQDAGAVWARRGEVLAVQSPGNAPGVHGLWPQALALGFRVAVRPSRREPLTAHRLVTALRLAGFADTDACYLPTGHTGADAIVRTADLTLVYGGRDVAERYDTDPTVLVNGPGRSKILITAEQDWRDYLDVVVDSVAALGGMACVNATAVLYEGDAEPLAHALGERLALLRPLPNADPRAVLPTMPTEGARVVAAHLARRAAAATAILGAEQVVVDVGDGFAALRPAVHLLSAPDPQTLGVELPFPCVWVSPWSRDDGLTPLRDSLVLTAISSDDELIDRLVHEPTIGNVYRGSVPTHRAAPEIPHDGFLADFLMRNKGFAVR